MISPFNPRARRAICRPVQFVSGETGSLAGFRMRLSTSQENLPVIVIRCKFQSAAPLPSQGCSGQDRDGFPSLRLGLLFLRQLPRMMRPKPHRALLGSPMSQLTRDISRVLNFCRRLTGWSFRSLHHLRQEPRSVFAVLFRPCLSVRVIHANKHGENDVEKIRLPSGDFRNVEC
jgi:hypothetical protein